MKKMVLNIQINSQSRQHLTKNSCIRKWVLILGVLIAVPMTLWGMTESDKKLLKQFQEEEPEIYSRSRLVSERGRQLLEISLGDILKLVKSRSITLKSSLMGEQAALSQLALAEQPTQPYLTTKIQQVKAASLSATNLQESSVLPYYLKATSTDQTLISATWSKRNKLGMTFSTSLEKTTQQTTIYTKLTKEDSLSGGEPTDDPLESATLSIGMSVPLFQDFGEVNRSNEIRAEIGFEQSQLSTDQTELSLLESVAKTYWTLVGVRENISSLEEAVKLSALLVEETGARVDVGILNYTDLKEAETQLANNRQSLLSAKISEQEIEDQIRVALNLENVSFGFKPADSPTVHREQLDPVKLLRKSYANSVQIKLLMASVKANGVDLMEAENLDRTNLDLSLQYGFSGYGATSSESLQVFDNEPLQGYAVGLSWTVPLFDNITPKRIAQAKIKRSQIELQLQDAKSQLTINLQTILRNLRFGLEEEKNAILSKDLAKDLLEKEIEKLKIGKSTGYNVSQAQQKYTSARYLDVLVRVKNEQNFIALLSLTGDLYSHFNLPERE
jgi:outer membrane protein